MAPVIEDGEQAEGIRPAPLPAAAPAQTSPSIEEVEEEKPEESGPRAPDFGVSGRQRFRLLKPELSFETPASDETTQSKDSKAWTWDGATWSVTDRPGSTRTQQFVLRVKGDDGKYHYASSCCVSYREYNRRFAGRRDVADKKLKVTRERDYEHFKNFVFETWKAEAIRTNFAGARFAARDS
jgi:hypothetical protein